MSADDARPHPATQQQEHQQGRRGRSARSATVAQFGVLVRTARERIGWSQSVLARAAGMTVTKVCRIERGQQVSIHLDEVLSLAGPLGVPPAVLAGWARSDGRLAPPPKTEGPDAAVFEMMKPPQPRVNGPRARPGTSPPRVAGLLVVPRRVHELLCGYRPNRAVPGHAQLRKCAGCGLAVEGRLSGDTFPGVAAGAERYE